MMAVVTLAPAAQVARSPPTEQDPDIEAAVSEPPNSRGY